MPISTSQANGTPSASRPFWNAERSSASAYTAAADLARSRQKAASEPAASPMFHSTGCRRKQPLVMCVVPMFFAAASRLLMRTGMSAPSGILKRARPAAYADIFRAGAVDVDGIPADADRVREGRRPRALLILHRDILLHDGAQSLDAARLADVGKLGQPIRRVHDVGTQLQFRSADTAAGSGRFGLHPVQKAEADALGVLQGRRGLSRGNIDDGRSRDSRCRAS